jgi:hypothetical protein
MKEGVIIAIVLLLLLSSAGNANTYNMGFEVQFMLCFKGEIKDIDRTPISFIDPGDGAIQSDSLYGPMTKKVGTNLMYPGSKLVFSGGKHFIALERIKNRFSVWEFLVDRPVKATEWTNWQAPSFEAFGYDAELELLRGTVKKVKPPHEDRRWFRFRVIEYDPFASFGETPLCPGDAR